MGFYLCYFNFFPSVRLENRICLVHDLEEAREAPQFPGRKCPMSYKRMDPLFNKLPSPHVAHYPCDAPGNASHFRHEQVSSVTHHAKSTGTETLSGKGG